jgi:hypothetical protein
MRSFTLILVSTTTTFDLAFLPLPRRCLVTTPSSSIQLNYFDERGVKGGVLLTTTTKEDAMNLDPIHENSSAIDLPHYSLQAVVVGVVVDSSSSI